MFARLKKKWNVTWLQFALIFTTFALGGSLCGYAGRKLLALVGMEKGVLYIVVYVLLVTLLWPLAVLLVSIPLGQLRFFKHYIRRIGKKMVQQPGKDEPQRKLRIAIFASGAGSNAHKIMEHFYDHPSIEVGLVVSNKVGAGVLQIAAAFKVPVLLLEKEPFFRGDAYVPQLQHAGIDFIVLAGFLWKVPAALIQAYPDKIINIHPALLPKYGGKGMYGNFVHEAVIAAKEKESGITIHYVDEQYDHGSMIFQARCEVTATDTPASLAERIHTLEHAHYAAQIEKLLSRS